MICYEQNNLSRISKNFLDKGLSYVWSENWYVTIKVFRRKSRNKFNYFYSPTFIKSFRKGMSPSWKMFCKIKTEIYMYIYNYLLQQIYWISLFCCTIEADAQLIS